MEKTEEQRYKYWERRTIIASMLGYAMFYFVRKNLSVAMPAMQADLGITKADLGLFLTLHGLLYGVSKFVNGYIGDRVNARYFMTAGLLLSAACNFAFGFSSAIWLFGIFWMLNGWFQGMGFPPCARLLTHWVQPSQLATKMSVWNTSHSIGAGLVVIFCGYIVTLGWRWCFFGPGLFAVVGAIALWFALRDTPSSVGLPEIRMTGETEEQSKHDLTPAQHKAFVRKMVFQNPYIWILAFANFFLYTVRYAVLDWGPTLLNEWKGVSVSQAGWLVAAFEISGILGMLAAGWATDKFFGGRGPRVCVICMLMTAFFVFLFKEVETTSLPVYAVILGCAGFFIYGPQALVGIAASNLATKRAAATAVGLTGLFGYASTMASGWGLGWLAQHYGWGYAFGVILLFALIGTIIFLTAWKAKANGYGETMNNSENPEIPLSEGAQTNN